MTYIGSVMERVELEPYVVRGEFFAKLPDGRVRCEVCPRYCTLRDGQRAFCFVRQARGDEVVLTSYGRSTGFCIDPIEKKPLNHFYPGTPVLSFGTAGCNLGCKFCQNWDISKAREIERLSSRAGPEDIVAAAQRSGCASVAFTYNDPVIFLEYACDTADAARAAGIHPVAVTAGYVAPKARERLFTKMDAANVDLKGFTDEFYRKLCYGELEPVLETLIYLRHSDVWFEVTTLLIPGHNDSATEVGRLIDWFLENLGPDVPLHFTAFHPDYKMTDVPHTAPSTLRRARRQALDAGLRYVYTGNVHDPDGQSTRCSACDSVLIGRDGYDIEAWALDALGRCRACGTALPGRFAATPGTWGARRLPIHVSPAAQP